MASTVVAPFDSDVTHGQMNGLDCAGNKSGCESHSSSIDTQYCSESELEAYNITRYQPQPQDSALTEPADQVREGTLPHDRYAEATSIRLVLEKGNMWKQFYAVENEMLIARAGR